MSLSAKKHFGQNFLKDEAVLDRILESACLSEGDMVVEVGPGTGALTRKLSEKAGKVIALEVDRDLIPGLLREFPLSSNVSVFEQDVLKADVISLTRLLNGNNEKTRYKVVANIPYYITAPLLQYFLRLSPAPESMILMVQKEVAERICAAPGKMSVLGVSVQYSADTEYLFSVPASAFDPVPKVESAVVRLVPKREYDAEKDRSLFRIVKIGFASRRKTLMNNLASGLRLSKEMVAKVLAQAGFDAHIRAQALSVADWELLQRNLESFLKKEKALR